MALSVPIESQAEDIAEVQSRTICVSLTNDSPAKSTEYIALKNATHFSRSKKDIRMREFYRINTKVIVIYCL